MDEALDLVFECDCELGFGPWGWGFEGLRDAGELLGGLTRTDYLVGLED